MLLILFSYLLPLFPSFGMNEVGGTGTAFDRFLDVLHHLVLPAFHWPAFIWRSTAAWRAQA